MWITQKHKFYWPLYTYVLQIYLFMIFQIQRKYAQTLVAFEITWNTAYLAILCYSSETSDKPPKSKEKKKKDDIKKKSTKGDDKKKENQ